MSGSNGPDYSQLRPGPGGNDCTTYRADKALQAPNIDVVPGLEVGDVLDLALLRSPARVIAVVTAAGEEAGSVMPDSILISCLEQGTAYTATVIRIRGGHVMLAIAAA